ncbi:hypothetical protein TEA_004151 [Camellia sinensis var. sinensis]|uniref:Aldehyde dehydrogenase domain-containing protein n=1 Tax=Camellia sinensis var. sinensis TaxID=542762 RepID=A0A4S4E3M6_CAMSN|nr:hypothetical protein TEA_004151 [Camellia sinensis var. sinensis]
MDEESFAESRELASLFIRIDWNRVSLANQLDKFNKFESYVFAVLVQSSETFNCSFSRKHAVLEDDVAGYVKRFKTLRPQASVVGNIHLPSTSEPSWRQRYPPRVPNLIGGRFVDSQSLASIDIINPATQQVVSQVPLTSAEEFRAAVFAAKRAFPSWRNTPATTRQRIMFKLQDLIRRDIDKLALNITTEQGKTLKDAYSEVLRGLEVVEHACGTASLQMGEFASNVPNGIDTYSIREPLGVCAGICPFNFPAMIPLWCALRGHVCAVVLLDTKCKFCGFGMLSGFHYPDSRK